jgi:hypothetical protein
MRTRLAFAVSLFLITTCALAELGPIPGTQRIGPIFESADLVCNCVVNDLKVLDEQKIERFGRPVLLRHLLARAASRDVYNKESSSRNAIFIEFKQEVPAASIKPPLSINETALMFLKLTS